MKKIATLLLIGGFLVFAAVMSVSAMPDEGNTGGRANGAGLAAQVAGSEEASIDCVQSRTGSRLTREELKELRIELAMTGNRSLAYQAMVACSIQNQAATK